MYSQDSILLVYYWYRRGYFTFKHSKHSGIVGLTLQNVSHEYPPDDVENHIEETLYFTTNNHLTHTSIINDNNQIPITQTTKT